MQDTVKREESGNTVRFAFKRDYEGNLWLNFSDSSILKANFLPAFMKGGLATPYNRQLIKNYMKAGFSLGMDDFNYFGFNVDSLVYFNTRTPYTDLGLQISSKKEQYFKLLHTQNLTKSWNVAFRLLRTNGEGFYQRQNAVSNNLSVSSKFKGKKGRYGFLIGLTGRTFKKDESGGIVSDSTFENNIFSNKRLFSVELSDARSRRGAREFVMNHYLYQGPKVLRKADSLLVLPEPKSFFVLTSEVKESWYVYADKAPQSGYYANVLLDTTTTLDSTHLLRLANKIRWSTFNTGRPGLMRNVNTQLEARHEFIDLRMGGSDTVFNDAALLLEIFTKPDWGKIGIDWRLRGNYYLAGGHAGDYEFDVCIARNFSADKGALSLAGRFIYSSPEFIYMYYRSNHFWWYNTLEKVNTMTGELTYVLPKRKLNTGLTYINQDGFTYFDSTFLPKQTDSVLHFIRFYIKKDIGLKHWHFNSRVDVQQRTLPELHPVPQFILNHTVYYHGTWFKGVMEVALGLDVHFLSAYYAQRYMPATGLFYQQREMLIGNYPFVDVFFNFKIKRARIFLRADHAASGLLGPNFYLLPHYPANDRQFRVGISWKFFD